MVQGSGKNQGAYRRGPRPVADFVSKLLDPVIERRAGMTMDIVASWEEIVGEHHSKHSRPERLDWPRRAHEEEPFQPAMLVVACAGPQAVFVQSDSDTIIARVNAYFGFAAVARLKIVQKPLAKIVEKSRKPAPSLPSSQKERLSRLLATIEDQDLRAALVRMGTGVFSEGSGDSR